MMMLNFQPLKIIIFLLSIVVEKEKWKPSSLKINLGVEGGVKMRFSSLDNVPGGIFEEKSEKKSSENTFLVF